MALKDKSLARRPLTGWDPLGVFLTIHKIHRIKYTRPAHVLRLALRRPWNRTRLTPCTVRAFKNEDTRTSGCTPFKEKPCQTKFAIPPQTHPAKPRLRSTKTGMFKTATASPNPRISRAKTFLCRLIRLKKNLNCRPWFSHNWTPMLDSTAPKPGLIPKASCASLRISQASQCSNN